MKKIYKVPCYDLNEDLRSYRFIGKILVSRTRFCFVKELISDYKSIEILKDKMVADNKIKLIAGNTLELKKVNRGAGLFVIESDLIQKNYVREEDIDSYIQNYNSSEYKKLHTAMNLFTKDEKKNINYKVKKIMSTRKKEY